ncbi:MAG: methylmalonyl-CoA mutase small subunit [Bacteroidales bacterium]|nr:methylmalonyl-CoA mutase small subunit [Bacteroidales bacterium]
MSDNKLFTEFPPVSTEKWEEVINKDLKGADYDKKLVWHTIEGFNVKPYYRAEDLDNLEYLNTNPAEAPFVRGKNVDNNEWLIRQDVQADTLEQANAQALDALRRGATALGFCTAKVQSIDDMRTLFKDIYPEAVHINFTCGKNPMQVMQLFADYLKERGCDTAKMRGSFNCDPYGFALMHGHYKGGEEAALEEARQLVLKGAELLPGMRVLTVNGRHFHNAGSGIVQELAFTLSSATALMTALTDKGLPAKQVACNLNFCFATGSNYFMEIAKLRAARLLWSKIAEQYNTGCDCSQKVFIHCTGSTWNKSVYDPYVNMLRTTTETMSAAIGGADSISTPPFDAAYRKADDFGQRIARNQQLLLKEESYMDKIVDPSAGSYYIENLTDSIAHHAWQLFLQVEQLGGFAEAIKQGFVQDEIERTATRRDNDIATRRTTILGTNQYPNLQECMAANIAADEPRCCCKADDTPQELRPLHMYRGAEAFERLRLATEHAAHRPKVFLLTYGNLAMRKARAGFATNFFGVAGYEIIDNPGFASAAEGVEAALKANPDIVVMCSSDDEYAEIAQEICTSLKGKVKSIVLAGYPKGMVETYKQYGVDEFIHVKTNALESLTKFQQLLGV